MTDSDDALAPLLASALNGAAAARGRACSEGKVRQLERLSGGANMQTWSFDWEVDGSSTGLILRRLPPSGSGSADENVAVGSLGLATEAALLALAAKHGVKVPAVELVLAPEHGLGEAYIMSRECGDALPFRILADSQYAAARDVLAGQCGETLARIHRIPLEALPPGLRDLGPQQDFERLQQLLDNFGNASPVHQLALNWLRQHQPRRAGRSLVHGDFRCGNLLVDERGLVAVLDWELAHVGNPLEDLGYLCANVWRFGRDARPVGGFGHYEQLLDGYCRAGGEAPSLDEIRYWEVYAALGWGIVCLAMIHMHRSGRDHSLERAAVGRRMSESEMDLIVLLEELGP